MKIVVTGSLGHIGKPLTEALVKKGHHVTVISSKSDKRQAIEELGATAAIGSLDDAAFVAATFAGADAVYTMVPPNYAATDFRAYYRSIGESYAQAIQKSDVKRVVNLSSYGGDLDAGSGIILGAHDVEGILDKLPGLALTHLRPGYFYYNLLGFVGMIKAAGFIAANYGGDDKLLLVAPRDIAVAAAEELEKPSGERVRYIASDERTASETARVLGRAIGKPDLEWRTISDAEAKAGMEQEGMPLSIVAPMVELGSAMHSGILHTDYDKHKPAELGSVKLEDFSQEFAAAYNQ